MFASPTSIRVGIRAALIFLASSLVTLGIGTVAYNAHATPPTGDVIDTLLVNAGVSSTRSDASFIVSASKPTMAFESRLNGGDWKECVGNSCRAVTAPFSTNTIDIRATGLDGVDDPTPLTYTWTTGDAVPYWDFAGVFRPFSHTATRTVLFAKNRSFDLQCRHDGGTPFLCNDAFTLTDVPGTHNLESGIPDGNGNVTQWIPNTYVVLDSFSGPCTGTTVTGATMTSCDALPDGAAHMTLTGNVHAGQFVLDLPVETNPEGYLPTITIDVDDHNPNKPGIHVHGNIRADLRKTISMARGRGDHACVDDQYGVPLEQLQGSNGCPKALHVPFPADGSSHSFGAGRVIAVSADGQTVTYSGLLNTTVLGGSDEDADGVEDYDDACVSLPGTPSRQGCPSAVRVTFNKHAVGTGSTPTVTKTFAAGSAVKLFAAGTGTCAAITGTSALAYGDVFTQCGAAAEAVTDNAGKATFGVPAGQQWLVVGYDATTQVYAGAATGVVATDTDSDAQLQVLTTALGKSLPGKTTKRVGSLLYIVEPAYMEWDAATELYPYVLDAPDGDWGVTVTVAPPEGFTADYSALSAQVQDSVKAVQFTLTDQGSCWECGTGVTFTVAHKGHTERIAHSTPTPMTEEFFRMKGISNGEAKRRGITVTKKGGGRP